MVVLRWRLSSGRELAFAPRHWLLPLGAALVAIVLLASFVQMLHESMARGERLRGDWQSAPATGRTAVVSATDVAAR